jgi:hypothetical protein
MATGSSSDKMPRSTCRITSVVVASTLVSEARSKTVSSRVGGDSGSNVRRPNDSRHSGWRELPTSITAAGKARSAIACCRIWRAAAKCDAMGV